MGDIAGFSCGKPVGTLPVSAETNINLETRVTGKTDSDYFDFKNISISGFTDSRKDEVMSYDKNQPYKLGFDMNTQIYTNYTGGTVNGVNRVTSTNPTAFTYVFDVEKNDPNIGTIEQKDGFLFIETSLTQPLHKMVYIGQGWNETNISLSATTKEEYLLGIISRPEIQSDVFIDRGIVTVYEKHLKMSEITNISQLARYGSGYFNMTTI